TRSNARTLNCRFLCGRPIIYCKVKNSKFHFDKTNTERKAMKSLSVLIIVFIISRMIAMVLINVVGFVWNSKDC
ncbi:hypothetical protein PENTCL1PPCAC_11938, partial [Pristionchus entomophagus]